MNECVEVVLLATVADILPTMVPLVELPLRVQMMHGR